MRKNFIFMGVVACLLFFASCGNKPKEAATYTYPFQNPALSPEERAADLVARLTLEEKIDQMLNGAPAIERLGIPEYNWWSEALHGVGVSMKNYHVTVFPQAIGLAATWDTSAVRQMCDYIALEGRAIYNVSRRDSVMGIGHGLTFWSPNINIFRDPRWGRGQETYGEDPFLTAQIGSAFVKGLQGTDPVKLKVAACAKHYAVHSGPEPLRHVFDAKNISMYDLWDTYLPAFQELVTQSKVAGVMCAYNAYEGQPCCGSDHLMLDILREDWKFTGYVTSDCGAIDNFYKTHKYKPDAPAAAADAVYHGTDVDCGNEAYRGLKEAVEKGLISESQIDISLKRLFTIRFRLGMFDPIEQDIYAKIDTSICNHADHKAQALKMARESMVLLKNDGILPLKKENLKKIAIMGPNMDNPEMQLGNYTGYPKLAKTPLNSLKALLPNVEIIAEQGCNYTENEVWEDLHLENLVTGDGFAMSCFNNDHLEGKPVYTATTKNIDFTSGGDANPIAKGVNLQDYSTRFEGSFIAPVSGTVDFKIAYDDAYRLFIDHKKVSESVWNHDVASDAKYRTTLIKGKEYHIKLEHRQGKLGGGRIALQLASVKAIPASLVAEKVKDADVIVFLGGISPRLEGEEMGVDLPGFKGGDRTTMLLPKVQTDILKALKNTGKPVILVLMNGCAMALPWEARNLNAIVEAWYGGEFAGDAIADLILGNINPSGHLPVTFYENDKDLPDFLDYSMKNRTYKYFTGKALYPFGFGLSYTTFNYEWEKQPKTSYAPEETIECVLTVKNTGNREGDAVTQVYIKYPQDGQRMLPLKELRFFDRKNIAQGGNYSLKVSIPVSALAKWDNAAGKQVVPAGKYSIFAGTHSEDEAVSATFDVK
ncbi:MAG: glycoside hydrolase family 3 C-terminal domain-containing protein [Bacteroidales bacterium]|jgi:beta-glucosidase|nr:glycoside hydrolase family 3 C-terminal domain-containing protein [Bacteroidales bacterium]